MRWVLGNERGAALIAVILLSLETGKIGTNGAENSSNGKLVIRISFF
jgi:hypothetical protein